MSMLYVIIPVYNCEKYLKEAVDSVLAQPFKDIQIVIVNDGSTDTSGGIADAMQEQCDNIIVLHQENQGVSAARNTGIEYVIQQDAGLPGYIAFLDADDLWAKDAVDTTVADEMHSSICDLICFGLCHTNQSATRCDIPVVFENKAYTGGLGSVYAHPLPFGTVFYSVRLLKDNDLRFFEGLSYTEDQIFKMQCFYLANKIKSLKKTLYLYRRNQSSVLHSRPTGIPYFISIINGWSQSDIKMYQYKDIYGELREGHTLASVYMLEMAQEHYEHFGRRRRIEAVLKSHSQYAAFLELRENCVSAEQWKEYQLLKTRPTLFQVKHIIMGIKKVLLRALLRLPAVNRLYEKRCFPIENTFI